MPPPIFNFQVTQSIISGRANYVNRVMPYWSKPLISQTPSPSPPAPLATGHVRGHRHSIWRKWVSMPPSGIITWWPLDTDILARPKLWSAIMKEITRRGMRGGHRLRYSSLLPGRWTKKRIVGKWCRATPWSWSWEMRMMIGLIAEQLSNARSLSSHRPSGE